MIRKALCLAALLAAAPARAATYYVATNGSDSSAGSSAAPFKTLQAGINKAGPGDTIIVRDGTYGPTGGLMSYGATINKAGSSSAWITLEAEHPGMAVLDCQLTCHSYLDFGGSSAYWAIKGFVFTRGYWSGIFSNSGGGKNILVQNNRFEYIGNQPNTTSNGVTGIYTDVGATNFRVDRNVFHDIGRTTDITGNHDHAIYAHGNLIITNNVFYKTLNGWFIQTAAGFSGTIANNTFYGAIPTTSKVGQITLWGGNSNLTIRNNVFLQTRSVGITVYQATVSGSCSIDHNLVFTSGATDAMLDSTPSGCSVSSNKLNADPKLSSPSGLDFRETSGGPTVDAGAAVSGVTTDFAGASRPQGAAFDIGAYEYGASAPSGSTSGSTTPSVPAGCVSAALAWKNASFAAQSGSFIATFDVTPGMAKMDGVVGLSNGAAAGYAVLAAAVRFNNAGYIDARNGGIYGAAASIPYAPGTLYHFKLTVNIPAHVYTAAVAAGSGAWQTIGSNYAFRTEQAGATLLNNVGMFTSTSNELVCSPAVAPTTAAAPAITAVAASNVGNTAATIGWVTDKTSHSQVEYGVTTSYGTITPQSTATGTSHSVSLSNLQAGTAYHYRCRSLDSSTGLTGISGDYTLTTAAAASGGCTSASAAWKNVGFTKQTGSFTLQFDATPSMAKMDGVMGPSNGAATGYASLAAAVRFNNAGYVDARNGGAYAAAAAIPYSAGAAYHFRLVVNIGSHTYSAYVRQGTGTEKLIGSGYRFRTEQAGVTALSNLGLYTSTGSETVCSPAVQ